jgi:tetratricopeptide (TPR) repeat protein
LLISEFFLFLVNVWLNLISGIVMKKHLILLSAFLFVVANITSAQNYKKFYKAGNEFMDMSKYQDAVSQYTKAIEIEPSMEELYVARARAYEKMKDVKSAYNDYETANGFAPRDIDVIIKLGALNNDLGNYSKAYSLLNRASSMEKRNSKIYPEKVLSLMGMQEYDKALKVADTAIILRSDARIYYYRGMIYVNLHNDVFAKKEFEKSLSKDSKFEDARLALADLYLRKGSIGDALEQCNMVIKGNEKSTNGYLTRSKIYVANLDYPAAINDISRDIVIDPENADFYFTRGNYYQQFNQHSDAIIDFNKYISAKPDDPAGYFARAKSYEETMNFEKATADYEKITRLSEYDLRAQKLLADARKRLYELNRESLPPEVNILNPQVVDDIIDVRGDNNSLLISGTINEKSKLSSFQINGKDVHFEKKGKANGSEYEFLANVDVTGLDNMAIRAEDEYGNVKALVYTLNRTEVTPPVIAIIAPYASDDGQVYIDNSPSLFIEGKVADQSKIKSIFIEGVTASYPVNQLNPTFNATVDVANKNKITVIAEDIYGNRQVSDFKLNRDGVVVGQNNPMGKTWVVFIENSQYTSFASLDGPVKDISLMKRAFSKYQINNIIHKQNMTKSEMEKFFSIELRDLIKSNQVKSLLIWYAGHGKFINDVGYWIPVDAKRDDEFTYFNINSLRASMESYVNFLTHTLVVSDACESGPSFYQAMRSDLKQRSCGDWQATQFKSSQVFSSAGYELAVDNSQFSQTFANTLSNNPNACIPIEEIVTKVSTAVQANNQQKPKFGKITGLKDEDGTFFFITKQ